LILSGVDVLAGKAMGVTDGFLLRCGFEGMAALLF
jgi:hypothetical protein